MPMFSSGSLVIRHIPTLMAIILNPKLQRGFRDRTLPFGGAPLLTLRVGMARATEPEPL